MARFMGSVQGQAGEATRLGSPKSGLVVEANGWHSGVKVVADAAGDIDEFHIYATGGGNNSSPSRRIATIRNGVVELL